MSVHRCFQSLLVLAAALDVACTAGAAEVGDDCKPVVAAVEKSFLADHVAVTRQGDVTTHEVTFGGQSWTDVEGHWRASHLSPQDMIDKSHEDVAGSRQFSCTSLPDALVDGVAVLMYAVHIEKVSGQVGGGRIAIARATGLVVSTESDSSARDVVGLTTHFRYDDVKPPM